jgi:hypothetical protein
MWKTYVVRYWNHRSWEDGGSVNDCFGNSISWVGKARTEEEALRKSRAKNANNMGSTLVGWAAFRLHSIKIKN